MDANDDSASPLVSVVVVSYNYESFVRQAVESVLAQTYRNLEVIVVDDGSTDGSRSILAGFGDRIRLVLKPNGGETSAANSGFAVARGAIVMFVDSDDLLAPTAVAEIVAAWRPRASKVQFRLSIIDAAGQRRGTTTPCYPDGFSSEDVRRLMLSTGIYPSPPTTGNAYSRAFLAQVMPLDTELFQFGPDGALNTIAPLYGDVIPIDKALGSYRIHGQNMWAATVLDARRMLSYLEQGAKEAVFLRRHAAALGISLSMRNPMDYSFEFLERRLAARTLAPQHPLVAEDRPLFLFWRACLSIGRYERRLTRRMIRLGWFLVTALMPRALAVRLLEYRFTEARRPRLVRRMIGWLNGAAGMAAIYAMG